jgi:UDP-glucose 4-epimerase
MRNVLVTHADEPVGRRIVKTLFHDARIGAILAVGEGPPPRAFDAFFSQDPVRVHYQRTDLVRYRTVSLLFRSPLIRTLSIDSVIHVPRHGASALRDARVIAGVSERTAEARLVLQGCLQEGGIRRLVAIGSAFVYRLAPGNSNRLRETSELDLNPDVESDIRAWINCDMLFQSVLNQDRLRVALLRVPTIVGAGGELYMSPAFAGRDHAHLAPLGFDPICPLVSDKDVARAVQCAIHSRRSGVYNIAGHEALPVSVVRRWTGRRSVPIPGPLLGAVATASGWIGIGSGPPSGQGRHLRYGFTLDTSRAERELGFAPAYRIGLAPEGEGALRVEAFPA